MRCIEISTTDYRQRRSGRPPPRRQYQLPPPAFPIHHTHRRSHCSIGPCSSPAAAIKSKESERGIELLRTAKTKRLRPWRGLLGQRCYCLTKDTGRRESPRATKCMGAELLSSLSFYEKSGRTKIYPRGIRSFESPRIKERSSNVSARHSTLIFFECQ